MFYMQPDGSLDPPKKVKAWVHGAKLRHPVFGSGSECAEARWEVEEGFCNGVWGLAFKLKVYDLRVQGF